MLRTGCVLHSELLKELILRHLPHPAFLIAALYKSTYSRTAIRDCGAAVFTLNKYDHI